MVRVCEQKTLREDIGTWSLEIKKLLHPIYKSNSSGSEPVICDHAQTLKTIGFFLEAVVGPLGKLVRNKIRPGPVKLVLCGHWMHLSYMHQ